MQKNIIILGRINKKFLLPFLLALTQILFNIFNEFYPEKDTCNIILLYSLIMGKISIRLFPFIFKISNEETTFKNKIKKKKWLYYVLLCFIDFLE